MKAKYKLQDVDQIEATLAVTMKIGDWKSLLDQLDRGYPSWVVANKIKMLIETANQTFEEHHDATD